MGMAALNGWCNRISGNVRPFIWMDIANNFTNMEDLHQIIKRAVTDTARNQDLEISKSYLTDNMLKDVVRLDFAP